MERRKQLADIMSVQVMKGQLRKEPSFLSPVLRILSYTETVTVLSQKEDWVEIKADKDGVNGWLHASALTAGKIELDPGSENVKTAVSSDEYALAGKGFSKEVEKGYKSKNPHMNFSWIDKMETFMVSHENMKAFLQEGKVISQGGIS